jgi:hypothetical protein
MTTALWIMGTLGGTGIAAVGIYLASMFAPRLMPYAIAATVAVACFGSYTIYVRHQAVVERNAEIEKEKTDAIDAAAKARQRVRDLCDRVPAQCVQDDWFRD